MPFISKTLWYSFCACVRNILKIVTFVIEKMKLASFSLFLDASPPRPKMPFGQLNVAIQIYNICKWRLGSRGGKGLYKRKKTLTVPRRYFFCGSFMFLFCLVFAMFCARLFICASWSPAGKGLTSWLSFVVSSVSLSLSHWYPGSGVVLDCIDS